MHSIGNVDLLLLGVALFLFFFNYYYWNPLGFYLKNLVFCKSEGYSDEKINKEFRLLAVSQQHLE